VKPIGSFTKTKEATSSQIFYPFKTISAQQWPSKSKITLPLCNEANRTFVAAKPTRLNNGKNGRKMKNVS
jgi:hypothetical protein